MDLTDSELRRFWSKVDQSSSPDACWEWTDAPDRNGYGRIWMRGATWQAHRISLMIEIGPSSLHALHTCDNPPCVNPRHLFYGTQAENMADMESKGRSVKVRGEDHSQQKLTEKDVIEIKRLLANGGATGVELARRFGVGPTMISAIKHERTWKHVN